MSSSKERQRGKQIPPGEAAVDGRLQSMGASDLRGLVRHLANESPEARTLILEWLRKHSSGAEEPGTPSDLDDELLFEYWENASGIMSEFNQYGGGAEDEEEEARDWLWRVVQLAEEGHISTKAKLEFMDEAFVQYNVGNSGFEDDLADAFFTLCDTQEEWKHLVRKLKEHPSHWRNTLAMRIYRNYLKDDAAYLQERLGGLQYGLDYWDLVQFYRERGDSQRAVEAAEKGIQQGEGRLTELFEFLFQHFAKKQDDSGLGRVVGTAVARGSDEKTLLDRLFDYYQGRGDYEKAKDALLKSFAFVGRGSYYHDYNRIKAFLNPRDWDDAEPGLFRTVQEKSLPDYLRICLDKNMKQTVLQAITDGESGPWGLPLALNFDEFAEALKEDFPDRIIEYHWNLARQCIRAGSRKAYETAAHHLRKAKQIYVAQLKDEVKWKQRLAELKAEFRRLPAFLDEVKNL